MGYGSRHGWLAFADRLASTLVDHRFPPAGSYEKWVAEQPTPGGVEAQLLVSVLVPVKDPDPAWLDGLARSVLDQSHAATELVLADDGCRDPRVLASLERLGAHERVRLVHAGGQGISGATNAAARVARGEVLAFADHDDLLAEGVLRELARAFEADPRLDLAFTDEDMLDGRGRRVAPSFRPGASPWLALGFNCACHLLAVRRGFFDGLGGLRSAFDGAQDHDLLLRALEQARAVRHLSRVGYHWRRAPGSVAAGSGAKPWAYEAGRRAVADACRRRGLAVAAVEHGALPGVYRVEPEPADPRVPARLVLHGPAPARERWRRAAAAWPDRWELLDERWPAADSDRALLVVHAATRPDPAPLRRLLSWLAQPGVEAVAGVTHDGRRRTNLGFAVDRGGAAHAVCWRAHRRALGPGLLGAAPRELAAGGEQLLALAPGHPAPWPVGAPVRREDLLAAGLHGAGAGVPLLLDPRAELRLDSSAGSQARSMDLRASKLWEGAIAALPPGFFTAAGSDPWCPRQTVLEALGLPPPAQSSSPSHTTV